MADAAGSDGAGDAADDERCPPSFLCPVGYSIMTDPVITLDGHTYERGNIERWFRVGHTTSVRSLPHTRTSAVLGVRVWSVPCLGRLPLPQSLDRQHVDRGVATCC